MPWENNQNPWGRKPDSPKKPGPNQGPDLDEVFRKGQERLRQMMGGGKGSSQRGIVLVLLVILFIYAFSGFYRVQEDEQGVVLRFGKWVETTVPGLNYALPWPIETVYKPKIDRINEVEIGSRNAATTARRGQSAELLPSTFMLAGDEAFVDVEFNLAWKIRDAGMFLFNIRDQQGTIIAAADSAMREVISQIPFQRVLNEDRRIIESKVESRLQQILDSYGAGVQIVRVQLDRVEPPSSAQYNVLDAYYDVQRAREDLKSARNKAEAYRNDIIPRARGRAVKIVEEASAYREQTVNQARGDASRFQAVLREYRQARDVTRKRIYIETMEEILSNVNKVMVSKDAAGGVIPFLPLPEVQKRMQNMNSSKAPKPGAGQ